MNSILQRGKYCWVCQATNNLHKHHIFFGSNRKISEQNGFTVYLCADHHNLGTYSAHLNHELDIQIKRQCQRQYEKDHTREEFIALIGKSYL